MAFLCLVARIQTHLKDLQKRYNIASCSCGFMDHDCDFSLQLVLPFFILTGVGWLLVVIGFAIGSNQNSPL